MKKYKRHIVDREREREQKKSEVKNYYTQANPANATILKAAAFHWQQGSAYVHFTPKKSARLALA